MSYKTKTLITDAKSMPVPQYFNPNIDDNEPIFGAYGASRVLLYDSFGNPLLTAANPGVIKVSENTLSAVTTLQNAASAVGTGTPLPTSGQGVASIAVTGPFVGTISFEGQAADGNWYPVNALQRGTGTYGTTSTSTGLYEINTRGLSAVRANITAYTSGSITAKGVAQPISNGEAFVLLTGSNVQVVDTSVNWTAAQAAGTLKIVDVPLPASLQSNALYEIIVTNSSADTDITVIIQNKATLGGSAKYPELTRFGVPKNTPDGKAVLVQGWLMAEAGRIVVSNDATATNAFTAYIHARKV